MRIVILVLVALLSGCTVMGRPAEVRAWVGADQNRYIGRNPIGNLSITQPLPYFLELHYMHSSSLVERDEFVSDQFGVGICVRFPIQEC
jgi:hypothetical protein